MSICDEQPDIVEALRLLIQAQLYDGHTFFLVAQDSDEPEPTTDVESIIKAICGEEPILRFAPKSHRVADYSEGDTCDDG